MPLSPWSAKGDNSSQSNAFSSPTAAGLAARRSPTSNRSPPQTRSPTAAMSPRGKRDQITSVRSTEEADILNQITASTTVVQRPHNTNENKKTTKENINSINIAERQANVALVAADKVLSVNSNQSQTMVDGVHSNSQKHSPLSNITQYSSKASSSPAVRRFEAITKQSFEEYKARSPRHSSASTEALESVGVPSADIPSDRSVVSSGSARRSLDLMHNDNAFHVIANIVLERFRRHSPNSDLDAEDWSILNTSVPESLRVSFIKAVRFRFKYNCPPSSEAQVHVLTRECAEYNLGKDDESNPLLRPPTVPSSPVVNDGVAKTTIETIPTVGSIPNTARESFTTPSDGQTGSRSVSGIQQVNSFQNNSDITSVAPYSNPGSKIPQTPASPTKKPPLAPSNETDYHKRLRAREVELLENASVSSVLTTPSIEQNQVATTESLARKQLMAELKEASILMAESQTPEAADFWKNHVISLQARLRSLHYDEGTDQERPISPPRRPAPEPQPKPNVVEQNKEELYTTPNYGPSNYNNEFFHPTGTPNSNVDRTSPYPNSQVRSSPYTTPIPDAMPSPYSHASNNSKHQEIGGDLVEVLAPADLPAGFQFEAELEGQRFLATVPYGGVKKGDTFSCIMRELGPQGPIIPVGGWRDRLCDCTKFGICHSVNINTLFCPLLSLGQVMTRLKLDALGRPTRTRTNTWGSMWTITIFWIVMNVLIYVAFNYKWANNLPLTTPDYLAVVILNLSGIIFTLSAVSATRAALREVYDIREYRFYDLEDNCCAMFCMPCTICQMHRHTAPYDQLEAHACTNTGLRSHADLSFIEASMKPLSL